MIKKERDSKFIIYQVLYIFVITVLALKGADLDLSRVVSKDKAVDKSVRDSLVVLIDSLYSLGLNFDIKVNENTVVENEALKEKLASMNKKMQDLALKVKEIPPEIKEEPIKKEDKEQTLLQSPISISQTFIQYTWNIARNTGNVPTAIYDPKNLNTPLVIIPPNSEKKFDLRDQAEVIAKFGSQEEKIKVLPNKPPEIKIERVTTKMSSSDIYVQDLQRVTVFTVTIIDERPEQLKIVNSGPISVSGPKKDNKGNLVYNVSLKIASTQTKYDEWLDRYANLREPDGRYKVNFFFTATDEISKDRVQVGDSFYFTDFSK
ncbi:MAG: hypothetical protein ABI550_08925 [Ignavibacteriaceae bacterium]